MILGSHNSWSYLPVRKWWMKPIAFMARCQNIDIRKQYEMGVRCFDLRIRYVKWKLQVAHGIIVYDITEEQLMDDLEFLDSKGDCMVRILHEARTREQYEPSLPFFESICYTNRSMFPNIRWWCGRNLYNWEKDYDFGIYPTCEEKYGSVSKHKWLYAWWPWLYARLHNKTIRANETDMEILLIDYINI